MKYKLGVIGFGVMGQAIVTQAMKKGVVRPEEVVIFDLDKEKISSFGMGANGASSIQEVISYSSFLLFAVKPQQFDQVIAGQDLTPVKTILTIMAGVKIETIRKKTGFSGGIVRIMPNTPCGLGKGVCAYCPDGTDDADVTFATDILSSCGDIVKVNESQFDAVTSVSGSGPAYVYLFAQGMIQGGMEGGLSYEESKKLALNTLIGAAELAKSSDLDLDTLIDRVCSKGGTTIEAVKTYRENGLNDLIAKGIAACRKRSEELSRG